MTNASDLTESLSRATTASAVLTCQLDTEAGPDVASCGNVAGHACVSEMAACPACGGPAVCCPDAGCY